MKLSLCAGCGRDIETKFRFCPWCGFCANENKDAENYEKHIEITKLNQNEREIENFKEKLDSLEKELDVLVLSAQLAR